MTPSLRTAQCRNLHYTYALNVTQLLRHYLGLQFGAGKDISWRGLAMVRRNASFGAGTITKTRSKRPGTHAKSKTSRLKQSKNYKKKYRGQGR